MRGSLIILCAFLLGVFLGRLDCVPQILASSELSLWTLWVFMFLVGLSVGADKRLPQIIRNVRPVTFLLPLATTIGTLAGVAAIGILLPLTLADSLAVGAGFGYYSLSSIFITQYKGADLGAIALLANITRELFALLLMPALVSRLGPMAGISSAGVTSMDTTLPVISQYAGPAYIMPAIAHGMALDFSVPFWVGFFCSI